VTSVSFSFSALTLLVGQQEGYPARKILRIGLLVVTFWLELSTSYSSSCCHYSIIFGSNKIQIGDILVLANPGPPGKMTVKMESDIIVLSSW